MKIDLKPTDPDLWELNKDPLTCTSDRQTGTLADWQTDTPSDRQIHNGMWLVIASGMTIFFFLKTGLNLKETLAKNILAYVSVDFSIK